MSVLKDTQDSSAMWNSFSNYSFTCLILYYATGIYFVTELTRWCPSFIYSYHHISQKYVNRMTQYWTDKQKFLSFLQKKVSCIMDDSLNKSIVVYLRLFKWINTEEKFIAIAIIFSCNSMNTVAETKIWLFAHSRTHVDMDIYFQICIVH